MRIYNSIGRSPLKQQAGAALVVALILLAAITVIGLSNVQSTSLELKMVASQKLRHESFAIAEAALLQVEDYLEDFDIQNSDLWTDTCTDGRCFTATCTGGLCFDGEYENADPDINSCVVAPNAAISARQNYWEQSAIWATDTTHGTVTVSGGLGQAKYIIEFLCFVGENVYHPTLPTGDPLFRITVLHDDGEKTPVMLQSTYSIDI